MFLESRRGGPWIGSYSSLLAEGRGAGSHGGLLGICRSQCTNFLLGDFGYKDVIDQSHNMILLAQYEVFKRALLTERRSVCRSKFLRMALANTFSNAIYLIVLPPQSPMNMLL